MRFYVPKYFFNELFSLKLFWEFNSFVPIVDTETQV